MEEEDGKLDLFKEEKEQNSIRKKIEHLLFEALDRIFQHTSIHYTNSRKDLLKFLAVKILFTIQMISLCTVNYDLHAFETFDTLWTTIMYTRLDYLSYNFKMFNISTILIKIYVFLIFSCFCLVILLIKNEKAPYSFIITIIKLAMNLFSKIFFVPVIILLSLEISQLFNQENEIFEGFKIKSFDGGVLGILSSIICLILAFLLVYLTKLSENETRHKFYKTSLQAECSSEFSIKETIMTTIEILLYCCFSYNYTTEFLVIFTFIHFYLAHKVLVELPKYNDIPNKVLISVHFVIAFSNIAFILGRFLGHTGVPFLLQVIFTPVVIYLSWTWIFERRKKQLSEPTLESIEEFSSAEEFERTFRPLLVENDPYQHKFIIKAFSKQFQRPNGKSRKLIYWEAVYCYYNVDDIRLSLIKLSKTMQTPESVEANYMIHKIKKEMESRSTIDFEDIDYLNYILKFEDLKKKDIQLCEWLIYFLEEISYEKDFTSQIQYIVEKVGGRISEVSSSYSSLVEEYPNCLELQIFYLDFVKNITHIKEVADYTYQWVESLQLANKVSKERMSFFNVKNGIMIVSGREDNIGTITYVNEKLSLILEQVPEEIVGCSLQDYIPYPFNLNHNSYIRRFLMECSESKVDFPSEIFLVNSEGYLIEVEIDINCVAQKGWPSFVVIVELREVNRNLILIDREDNIMGVTLGTCKRFNMKKQELIGINIRALFDGRVVRCIYKQEVCEFNYEGEEYLVETVSFRVHSHTIRCVIINNFLCECDITTFLRENNKELERKKFSIFSDNPVEFFEEKNKNVKIRFEDLEIEFEEPQEYTTPLTIGEDTSNEPRGRSELHKKTMIEKRFKKFWRISKILLVFEFLLISAMINSTTFIFVVLNPTDELLHNIWSTHRSLEAVFNIANYVWELDLLFKQHLDGLDEVTLLEGIENRKEYLLEFIDEIDEDNQGIFQCSLKTFYDNHYFEVWDLTKKEVKNVHFKNFVQEYIEVLNSWFSDRNEEDFYYLMVNGISKGLKKASELEEEIADCNIEHILQTEKILYNIQIWCSSLLFFLFITQSILAHYVEKEIDLHWKMVLDLFANKTSNIINSAIERLEYFFKITIKDEKPNNYNKIKSKNSLIKIFFRSLRFSTIIVLAMVYFFVFTYFFIPEFENYMKYKIEILKLFSNCEGMVNEISYTVKEIFLEGCCSLSDENNYILPILNPYKNMHDLENELKENNKEFLELNHLKNIDEKDYGKLFVAYESESKYLEKGLYSSLSLIYYDGEDLIEKKNDLEKMSEYLSELSIVNFEEQEYLKEIAETSEKVVYEEFLFIDKINILTTVLCLVIILLIFFLYFRRVKKNLENRTLMFELAFRSVYNVESVSLSN